MRYIVVFLILANLGYFGWSQFLSDPALPPAPEAPRALLNSGITLVSEYQARLAAEPPLLCYSVSGFATLDDANSFIAGLGEIAHEAELDLAGEPLSPQYRVYLPPATSRGIATIMLDSLSESLAAAETEIETYLITRGMLENGIALGVFSELAAATEVLNTVQALGYAPEIEEIPRSTGEIGVDLRVLERDVAENPQWLEITLGQPALSITENLCETIAQGTQFP